MFSNTATSIFVSDGTTGGSTVFSDVVGALSKASVGLSVNVGAATTAALAPTTPTASALGTPSTTTLTLGTAGDTIGGTLAIKVGAGTTNTLTVAAGTSLTALATQINGNAGLLLAGVSAAYNAGTGALTISGPGLAASTISTTGTSLTETTPGVVSSTPGAGVDFTAAGISTLSATTAQTVLTSVTSAIADVAYQRGIIGASINQLTAASGVASSESVNLTAAESAIRSTDYGATTSNLAKFKVLSETGISALAQANSVQQEVTKLLQ